LTEALQLEEIAIVELHDAPRLLLEWPSRWDEFVTNIGPAFARSGPHLAGEAPHGIFPYRGMLASFLLEAFLIFVVMVLPRQIAKLRPYAPAQRPYEVIYYSGDELPRTEDLGGAQSGANGHAGGREAHHRTQTIHVARGGSLASKVVDAPGLKVLPSTDAVANLLAFKSTTPSPPPAEGLHSSLTAPSLPANVIAPAPVNVARDQSRGGLTLDSVVPPAPSISTDKSRRAPALNAAVVPPAPDVRSEHTLFAPTLDSSIIAPAPKVSRERSLAGPSLNPNVIGPASTGVSRDHARSTPALNASVIPPAPAAVGREVSPSRVQMNSVAVVPPPVSAPEREAGRNAKLNLPAPSVITPPPSADSARDLRRLESGNAGATSPTVVPPPPTQAGSGSFVSSIIGKLFGTQDVVPPPPTVSSGSASGTGRSAAGGGPGGAVGSNVIPPPPQVGSSTGGSGTAARGSASGKAQGASLGATNVIPPPPSVTGSDSGQGSPSGSGNSGGSGNGTALAGNVIPPPPSVGSGSGLSGSGRTGSGLGGPGDAGSVLAPPGGAVGNRDNSAVVISSEPGSKVGIPGNGGKGSLAMSPAGGDKPGLGGSGEGASIGHGEGPGSGLAREKTSEGSGAGKTGTSLGSDPNARTGISPTLGPGGAGTSATGTPAVPGVDVRGGSTSSVVTLPGFGQEGGGNPNLPGRSSVKQEQGPAITIVATSSSGGGFDFYGKLPGDNYTVYVDTAIGAVVMQFAEADPASHPHAGALIGPQSLRSDLPADLPHARVVIKCKLDASGNLKDLQVLEPGPAAMTAKIMAALPSWKFRPAMHGVQPVELNAILGFNIDTNDRY
jgi:hypothetical protein